MAEQNAIHFFLYQDCVLRIPSDVLVPKFGSLLLARHLPLQEGDVVLDLGAGAGLVGIMAARRGHRVVATDLFPSCSECARANALVNGVGDRLEVRTGDLFAPVSGESFDLIATNPPQMPTPPEREWDDAQSRTDNGGPDGWGVLDRIMREAPAFLKPQGRLVFTLFGFLGVQRAKEMLQAASLTPQVLTREEQTFPRIARERIEYIRSLDAEDALPPGRPATCLRYLLSGQKG
ncbi:MAG TPA: HemK2/MTQ2 family protein methyltransferase [Candidatus Methylomirabilis sp.]|nr:HemK2/MTQ2 family protein methyltransferase [Candidatus Methylomirabilis sp.]